MNVLENDIIKYWTEDGILYSEYKKAIDITLEQAKQIINLRHQISNNQKQYWCYDITKVKSYSKEVRDYADVHGQDFLYACASIVNSHVTMFIFNAFLKIKKVRIPFRAFKDKDKAVEWLQELKSINEKALK